MNAPKTHQPPLWTARAATIVAPGRRADVIEEQLDDEAVLIDPSSGRSHRLNQTALTIWHQCDGQTTTRQMAEHLTEAYEVDFDRALDHVEQVLALFAQAGLFESVDCP